MQKRYHTVPRCYLEGFTDKHGKVWVLDTEDKIFSTNPINIFVESNFYRITLKNGAKSLIVEDTLAKDLIRTDESKVILGRKRLSLTSCGRDALFL